MNSKIGPGPVLIVLVLLLAACSLPSALSQNTPAPLPLATPTAGSVALGTAPAPTPPPATALATAAAPAATSRLASPPPLVQATAGSPTAALLSPMVQQHFPLKELPGIGRAPNAITIVGDKVYVANSSTGNVAVIQNNRVVRYIPVGKRPSSIASDATSGRVWVTNAEDKSVSLLSNDQVTLTVKIDLEPNVIIYFENRLFVGIESKPVILVLDPATLKTQSTITLSKGFDVNNLAGDPVHHRIYATPYELMAVIDSTSLKVLSLYTLDNSYYTLAANPFTDSILTNQYDSKANAQYLVSLEPPTGKERARVRIGDDPRGAVLNTDGTRLYVANSYTNNVSVVDARAMTLLASVPVGMRPNAIALDDRAHRLYVGNYEGDSISVIDTDNNRVIATVPLGMYPTAVTANETTGRVYIANASTDSVFVVEGSSVIKEIPVGRHPVDLGRDEQSNQLYVANAADGTLSIIDESNFSVRTTGNITKTMTTVAVDAANSRIYAGDMVLDLKSLNPVNRLLVHGYTIGSSIVPNLVRINPKTNLIYAIAWNGTPGSNSRSITYFLDRQSLDQGGSLPYYGNTAALVFDPDSNRVFMGGSHPMAHTHALSVFDASDKVSLSLPLPGYTTGMGYNPQTHHLFISQTSDSMGPPSDSKQPVDNMVQVFDTTTFGLVSRLVVAAPGKMARLGNTVYIVSRDTGAMSIIQDTEVAAPPAPTLTVTPSPYPTWTPTPLSRGTPPSNRTGTPGASCRFSLGSLFAGRISAVDVARLGCPVEADHRVNFAFQAFERGAMYWREDDGRIYVLYSDHTWLSFEDKWTDGMPEDSCPGVPTPAGKQKPKRGFGKVWCDQVNVRNKLGGAMQDESGGYSSVFQNMERGFMMNLAPNSILVAYSNGSWAQFD